ncbi:MAG: phosphate/phosphite/phosphonate ABC transporter substrate-binding protein, partial [Trichlorobacter sp.]|uniref:phosphate/phosphite/phosphonate ABC transporter substrate-binding protein n=1 Tax=Trichlorobacter sp. TaxID=2911007 RepID=UPI00256997F7
MIRSRSMLLLAVCLFCFLLLGSGLSHAAEPAKNEYVLGVFPFLPSANLEGIFAPIAAEMSKALGKPVRLRLTSSYGTFVQALQGQTFDIVHIHPFDYLQFGRQRGYHPLVARSEDLFALFSVKNGSPIAKLSDLKGKSLGTPPATGAVTYLALDAVHRAGLTPGKDLAVRNFPNHLACLQQLQIGSVDSCATSSGTLKTFESQFGLPLKRIGHSISIPHTLFAAHSRIPAADREIIKKTLLTSS